MSDLQQAIEKAAQQVKNLLARGGQVGEEDTKAAIIDPVLAALGWDVHDLDDVRHEYRYKSQANPVDYAFFIGGAPKMFLEAKPLGTNLRDHKPYSQALKYAFEANVDWCVLTDGNHWHVYKSTAPVELERKLFLVTSLYLPEGCLQPPDTAYREPAFVLNVLSKANLAENEIAVLWKALFVDKMAARTLQSLVSDPASGLVRLIVKRSEGSLTKGDVQGWLARARVTIETSPIKVPPLPGVKAGEVKEPRERRKGPLVPGLPKQKDVELPLLRAMVRRGGEINLRQQGDEIDQELADELHVGPEQRRVTLQNSTQAVWTNRIRWVLLRLSKRGEVVNAGGHRGVWAITEQGRQRAQEGQQS
jgi:hypothetical protein